MNKKISTYNKETGLALIGIALLIIALAIGYYFVIFLPQQAQKQLDLQKQQLDFQKQVQATKLKQEQETIQQQQQVKANQQKQDQLYSQQQQQVATTKSQQLNNCLIQAHKVFNDTANAECKSLGYTDDQINNLKCYLPNMDSINKEQSDSMALCATLYK